MVGYAVICFLVRNLSALGGDGEVCREKGIDKLKGVVEDMLDIPLP